VASDCRFGASEESRVRETWSRKENAARTAPRYLCVAYSWESIFRNVRKDALEWGRCFCCDGGISSYALELVPFIRGELQLPAWYLSKAYSSALLDDRGVSLCT